MAWLALIAALQEVPSRWDFKPGSWVDMSSGPLRTGSLSSGVIRENVNGSETRPAGFTDGLHETTRRTEEWQGRPCDVVEYRDDTRTAILWLVKGVEIPAREMAATGRFVALPSNAVRALRVETKRAGLTFTSRMDVLELSAPIEAAGRRFDCVLESSSSTDEYPTGTILRSKRRWLSAEVPGHVVRHDRQCTDNPQAVPHDYLTRYELKAFHVEK